MVKSQLNEVFAALADPTRRAMLADLARVPSLTAGQLAEPHSMTLPAISKHLAVLERAGLLTRTRRGRHQICSLNPRPLREAADWLSRHERFWTERVDALHDYLVKETP
ncbi:ArsR/SmtB family transcription factor [Allorhizocola rhizosphaerae]|uniref:ArsR/SmtB family transcription factor n=1 Tax=Allorhizocola rhizosphaerae TaxID=1872709 RepID=UPI001FE77421|nr:metalloregulator ArsR/SmtB family transcription factor [Allorhizocola rhizosphaerae]